MKKQKELIRVFLKDGKVDEFTGKRWDDYEYLDGLFVIKKKGVWKVIYNMSCVSCISII